MKFSPFLLALGTVEGFGVNTGDNDNAGAATDAPTPSPSSDYPTYDYPTYDSTPSPSSTEISSCMDLRADGCHYTAYLYDNRTAWQSYQNGWEGSKLTITNQATGATVYELAQTGSGSVPRNTAETTHVSFECGECFDGQVVGGGYPEQKRWNIRDGWPDGPRIAGANSTAVDTFCISC